MIIETVNLLGHKATDKVTGFSGVITSVSFDLYGCVQMVLTPGIDDKGATPPSHWFDSNRLQITSKKRVMEPPILTAKATDPTTHKHGPAEKPPRD